jgi:glycolate oxidase iron-sulfur subunit
MMRAIADGELEVTRSFGEEMSYCLGCLACQTACPAGVNYTELFETARADVERSGVMQAGERSFWRWMTLDWLFQNPTAFRLAGRGLCWVQRLGLDAFARKSGAMGLLPRNLARLEPQTPRVSASFSEVLIREFEGKSDAKYRVAMLTGCVQDLAFSHLNRDTVDVLVANNCRVFTPRGQGCCGSLHGHNGEPEMARKLARRLLEQIDPSSVDAVITNAGGCGSHLRHFGHLLEGDAEYAARAKAWDAKVRDIHEWLVEIGHRAPQASPWGQETRVVTYHESCHLTHGQKVVAQPRAILRGIPGLQYVELPEANWCCGSAGVYSITQPEQAAKLLERKVRHIAGTKAVLVATANPGCHLQVTQGLRAAGMTVEVVAPVSLLAAAYRAEAAVR